MSQAVDISVWPEAVEGREALLLIDKVLAAKPEKDDYALTEATQKLCIFRDGLIARANAGDAIEREALSKVNTALSLVAAVHFPVGGVPWDALAGARAWLAELVGA